MCLHARARAPKPSAYPVDEAPEIALDPYEVNQLTEAGVVAEDVVGVVAGQIPADRQPLAVVEHGPGVLRFVIALTEQLRLTTWDHCGLTKRIVLGSL
ncbi:hypothetical protein RSOL_393790 [Rhizoctonia solani AG-3 Rhs1AP]|uniref:Uncharacterized protein n=2 Tax=Rhizoctonia solani AG-3 TaxID=1086053 RepID=A0A074RKP1_9AGAM|nr:hypothetical protein RSOL_393790 [Rhizoctonia solani AG-3 Rhs1AP]KEP45248.1 hypothetical protein V565_297450 [Rhizoctonia solani 123E]